MVTSDYTLFSLRLWRFGGAAILGITVSLTMVTKGMCDAPVPTPGPCSSQTGCVEVPRDENVSSLLVGPEGSPDWQFGEAAVGKCDPTHCTCPQYDVTRAVGVMVVEKEERPYTLFKSAVDLDHWYGSMGGAGCWPDFFYEYPREITSIISMNTPGTRPFDGIGAYKAGNPEGCPVFRTDTQTPIAKGYIHVFEVTYTFEPNEQDGLDITYSINQPTFGSPPPCQLPFVHDVVMVIDGPSDQHTDSRDFEVLGGWSDTWEWDGHFTEGNTDWNQQDPLTFHISGNVAGFEADVGSGQYLVDCAQCWQRDVVFDHCIVYENEDWHPCVKIKKVWSNQLASADNSESAANYWQSEAPEVNWGGVGMTIYPSAVPYPFGLVGAREDNVAYVKAEIQIGLPAIPAEDLMPRIVWWDYFGDGSKNPVGNGTMISDTVARMSLIDLCKDKDRPHNSRPA